MSILVARGRVDWKCVLESRERQRPSSARCGRFSGADGDLAPLTQQQQLWTLCLLG